MSRFSLITSITCAFVLMVAVVSWLYASSQVNSMPAAIGVQLITPEGALQVVDAPRETAAAEVFATNAVRLTEEATATVLPALDTPVSIFVGPQRLAGNGVILEGGVPDKSGAVLRHNEWIGYLGDQVVWVVAGEAQRLVTRPAIEGELAIAFFDRRDGKRVAVQNVPAPKGVGALAVLDVEGTNVILVGTGKPFVVFDLASMSFLSDEKAVTFNERRIGAATLRMIAPASNAAETITWQVSTADGSRAASLALTGPGRGTGWDLSAGQGATLDEARRAMRPVALPTQPFLMRVFDVRGHTVLFVENFGVITYFDMEKRTWYEGLDLAGAQPDYLASTVPEFASLWVENPTQTPTPMPAYP